MTSLVASEPQTLNQFEFEVKDFTSLRLNITQNEVLEYAMMLTLARTHPAQIETWHLLYTYK